MAELELDRWSCRSDDQLRRTESWIQVDRWRRKRQLLILVRRVVSFYRVTRLVVGVLSHNHVCPLTSLNLTPTLHPASKMADFFRGNFISSLLSIYPSLPSSFLLRYPPSFSKYHILLVTVYNIPIRWSNGNHFSYITTRRIGQIEWSMLYNVGCNGVVKWVVHTCVCDVAMLDFVIFCTRGYRESTRPFCGTNAPTVTTPSGCTADSSLIDPIVKSSLRTTKTTLGRDAIGRQTRQNHAGSRPLRDRVGR